MACLKCGRDTEGSFCADCLAQMSRYPVRPNTAVHLPRRTETAKRVVHKKVEVSAEEQIPVLKGKIRRLWIVVVILVLIIAGICAGCFLYLESTKRPLPGQNYSTVTRPSSEPTTIGN